MLRWRMDADEFKGSWIQRSELNLHTLELESEKRLASVKANFLGAASTCSTRRTNSWADAGPDATFYAGVGQCHRGERR